jgi:hypothetical protein
MTGGKFSVWNSVGFRLIFENVQYDDINTPLRIMKISGLIREHLIAQLRATAGLDTQFENEEPGLLNMTVLSAVR